MIQVTLFKQKEALGLSVTGHALHGKKGEDVLCAGVSAMAQMLELGISQVLGIKKK